MCGIIGILTQNKRNNTASLVSALARLEYRGYDSAGIALSDGSKLFALKCVGAPSQYLHESELTEDGGAVPTYIGIGHNRWATHGKPTLANAHPHFDTKKRIAVVHNGTILNYEVVKAMLQSKGVVFVSDTDTEVIPHLIAFHMDNGLSMRNAFLQTVRTLEGAFGVVAFDVQDPHTLYVAKEGSPIVIGIAPETLYVASSIHGFLPFTDRFMTLHDGECAVLTAHGALEHKIFRYKDSQKIKDREIQQAEQKISQDLSKGDFETFMLKEIYEQPASTMASIVGRFDEHSGSAVLGGLLDFEPFLRSVQHVLFTGCGTAYHAALLGAYLIEKLTNVSVRTEIASEGKNKTLRIPPETIAVFAVSQSGETADTVEYVKELKRKGYGTFGIVNVVGSALSEITGKGVYTKAGSEIGVASTKAFTSQLAVIYLLALHLARMRSLSEEEGRRYVNVLSSIPENMRTALSLDDEIRAIVSAYFSFTKIQFLGRGIHVPIAEEAALKFKEITYIESGAYPLGELKHGPIAVIDEQTLSVVILPRDASFEQGINSIEQIQSKGGHVWLITDESVMGHPITQKVAHVTFIPHLEDDLFYPFLEIIPLQLFAYHFAKLLGRNIDKPRNLAKSVTVQ